MPSPYSIVNIREYLDKSKPTYIGEQSLYDILSEFSCPPNPDVEHFLLHNSIEFTKKNQSVTYLVFHDVTGDLSGYFALAMKPISVRASSLSKTMAKRLARVSVWNEETNTYTTSAYLIAQIGKNFSLPKERRISGSDLLDLAIDIVASANYIVGGAIEFLECEDKAVLMDFYTSNGFRFFDTRITSPSNDMEPHLLNQLLKFI